MMHHLKDKIIEKGIILEEDWHKASKDHIAFASMILEYLQNNPDSEEEDDSFSDFEEIAFQEEFYEIQDRLELRDFDKVKSDKENDFISVRMKIPSGFAKFLQEEIFPEMRSEF
jgi:hypothetical protein